MHLPRVTRILVNDIPKWAMEIDDKYICENGITYHLGEVTNLNEACHNKTAIENALIFYYGKQCKDYCEDCLNCTTWAEYHYLLSKDT